MLPVRPRFKAIYLNDLFRLTRCGYAREHKRFEVGEHSRDSVLASVFAEQNSSRLVKVWVASSQLFEEHQPRRAVGSQPRARHRQPDPPISTIALSLGHAEAVERLDVPRPVMKRQSNTRE